MKKISKIALGGSCHWCTEGIFLTVKGVVKVDQGFVASYDPYDTFSEAVIVFFDEGLIALKDLIKIHLYSHQSTSSHSMRDKYRSAIYTFDENQREEAYKFLEELQITFKEPLVTLVLPFREFKLSDPQFLNYYYSNPEKPFCKAFIEPKIQMLLKRFPEKMEGQKKNMPL